MKITYEMIRNAKFAAAKGDPVARKLLQEANRRSQIVRRNNKIKKQVMSMVKHQRKPVQLELEMRGMNVYY